MSKEKDTGRIWKGVYRVGAGANCRTALAGIGRTLLEECLLKAGEM